MVHKLILLAVFCAGVAASYSGYGGSAYGDTGYGNDGYGDAGYGNSGYGNSGYGSNGGGQYGGHHHSSSSSEERQKKKKTKCLKLEHFSTEPETGWFNKKATFSYFKRDGVSYTRISCPTDGIYQILVVQKSGKKIEVDGNPVITGAVALGAGLNFEYIVRCYEDRTTGENSDKDTIDIEKVACISQNAFNGNL